MGSKTLKSQKPAAKRTHAYVGRGAYAVTPGGIAAMRSVAPEVADTIETTSASGIPSRTISPSALEALKARIARDARPIRPELAAIALEHLQIETLEERRSDALDFHNVGVLGVRDALDAAFELGRSGKVRS